MPRDDDVAKFLHSVKLEKHISLLQTNGYQAVEDVKAISRQDLKEMGLSLGERAEFMRLLGEANAPGVVDAGSRPALYDTPARRAAAIQGEQRVRRERRERLLREEEEAEVVARQRAPQGASLTHGLEVKLEESHQQICRYEDQVAETPPGSLKRKQSACVDGKRRRVGGLVDIERHPGSFDIVYVRDGNDKQAASKSAQDEIIRKLKEELEDKKRLEEQNRQQQEQSQERERKLNDRLRNLETDMQAQLKQAMARAQDAAAQTASGFQEALQKERERTSGLQAELAEVASQRDALYQSAAAEISELRQAAAARENSLIAEGNSLIAEGNSLLARLQQLEAELARALADAASLRDRADEADKLKQRVLAEERRADDAQAAARARSANQLEAALTVERLRAESRQAAERIAELEAKLRALQTELDAVSQQQPKAAEAPAPPPPPRPGVEEICRCPDGCRLHPC